LNHHIEIDFYFFISLLAECFYKSTPSFVFSVYSVVKS